MQQSLSTTRFVGKFGRTPVGNRRGAVAHGGALLRIRPLPGTQVKIGGHRKYRIPSLQELYAPSGFVLGNPDLRPEDTLDFFGELNFAKEQLELSGSLTHSWSEDLIVYVNRIAFELAPRNLGETERWIATLKGQYVMPELRLACGYDAFLSNVRDAPLPGIPPHQLWAKLIGAADATRLHLNHAFRSETAGDLFGNLKLTAYHLTDLQVVHPFKKDSNFSWRRQPIQRRLCEMSISCRCPGGKFLHPSRSLYEVERASF